MTFAAAIFAATVCVCTGVRTLVFNGEPADGVVMKVSDATNFTASVWVEAANAGSETYKWPRLIQLPCGYLILVENPSMPHLADIKLGIKVAEKGPGNFSTWQYTGALPLKQWAHVALVAKTGSNVLPEVYVNGELMKTRTKFVKPLPAVFKGGTAVLGNIAQGGNRPFSGRLADFRFNIRALSSNEIAELARISPDGGSPCPVDRRFHDELPVVDISHDTSRQTVIASGADGIYQGHPTTVTAPDGTIYCVWTINHGGPCGPMAKSIDGGRTWIRCDNIMPEAYRKMHSNCPTLQKIRRPDGGVNLAVFSSKKGKGGIVISTDGGSSWKEAPTGNYYSGMPPTGLMMLTDGSAALFGQVYTDPRPKKDRVTNDSSIWTSISHDGGWTWGTPRIVMAMQDKNLCEPCCLRSPDGGELCIIARENYHKSRSMMCFSRDEGLTWTTPIDTCWGLTGDRHVAVYLPDGRLFVAFRDRAIGSSTSGQYVAWIGSYDDLRAGRPGDCRVRLLNHVGENAWDTGYSGLEQLKDGSILCTTYMQYRPEDKANSVVCTRFGLADLAKVK